MRTGSVCSKKEDREWFQCHSVNTAVILSERKRVEESSQFVSVCSKLSAKILRLRALHSAQDDMLFLN